MGIGGDMQVFAHVCQNVAVAKKMAVAGWLWLWLW
jgi:hypothetical protein